ncbi:hypothetical protein ACIQZG_08440 [Lysinibacillus sp. NPDC096418]|uniref:hypothetical protein n=1 Tax=Lysinibacillus sp. NPDC096418 TaxID=3364138 RepID=UPI0037F83173
MKVAIELLQESKRTTLKCTERIEKEINYANEHLSNLIEEKKTAERTLIEIDEALNNLKGVE